MMILGLTGSIGMGKTTTLNMFKRHCIPTYDADVCVHEVYKNSLFVQEFAELFPQAMTGLEICRKKLTKHLVRQPQDLEKLERLVHPRLDQMRKNFLMKARGQLIPLVVLDIPLLFEKKIHQQCDFSLVVSAPFLIQSQRVLARKAMTKEKFNFILSHQMPDKMKRKHADFVIQTGLGRAQTYQQVCQLIHIIREIIK